jgi:hypothetical protein
MRRLAIGLLIAVGIGGTAWLLWPVISGTSAGLRLGDCFHPPESRGEVANIDPVPCSELHGGEVFFVGVHPGATSFPDDDGFNDYAADHCLDAYQAYTGKDPETDAEMDIGILSPSEDDWTAGAREVICYATRLDDVETTGSVKKP